MQPPKPYLETKAIKGNVFAVEDSSFNNSNVLSPVQYQQEINSCFDLLLETLLTMGNVNENLGKLSKLNSAMEILNFLFYEEMDGPHGQSGSVTIQEMTHVLDTGTFSSFYRKQLSPEQRTALTMFAT